MKSFLRTTTLLLGLATSTAAFAANEKVMMILDESGSMWGQIDGKAKIEIANEAINGLLNDWKSDVHLGVMAYGHREKGSCDDIETIIPIGPVDANAISGKLNGLKPKGKTPISGSLKKAAELLKSTEEKATVILVSDGLETCDQDPCAVAKELNEAGVDFTTHVVGFDLKDDELKQLKCIADNTGGTLIAAANASELNTALGKVKQAVVEKQEPAKPAAPVGEYFRETFDAGWNSNWEVINEDDENYIVDDGKLTIVSQHTTTPYPTNTLRLKKALPEGDWTATVKTTLESGKESGWGIMLGNPGESEKVKHLTSGIYVNGHTYVLAGTWYKNGEKESKSENFGLKTYGNKMPEFVEHFGSPLEIQLVRKGREYYTRVRGEKNKEWSDFGAVGVIKPLTHLHLVAYESSNQPHDIAIEFDDLVIEQGAAF